MSRIEELIKEKCPNGVGYRTLDKVCKINKGKQLNKDGLLSDENINNIIELITNRETVESKAIVVPYEEIKDNDYNISVNSYLKTNTDDNNIDIEEVNKMLAEVVPRQQQIRKELEEIIKELEVDYHE